MKLLKRKIELAKQKQLSKLQGTSFPVIIRKPIKKISSSSKSSGDKVQNSQENPIPTEKLLAIKNIAKNYGRAICNLILSPAGETYLLPLIQRYSLDVTAFRKYIKEKRDSLNGIMELRSLILKEKKDSAKLLAYKLVFQRMAEVFIKFFSVNWIFSGKLTYKMDYLKYRFKLLRRVRNPEYFTCLN